MKRLFESGGHSEDQMSSSKRAKRTLAYMQKHNIGDINQTDQIAGPAQVTIWPFFESLPDEAVFSFFKQIPPKEISKSQITKFSKLFLIFDILQSFALKFVRNGTPSLLKKIYGSTLFQMNGNSIQHLNC